MTVYRRPGVDADQLAVNAGGTLLAFEPSALLAPLMGILPATGTMVQTTFISQHWFRPGMGIVNRTMQYHGAANQHLMSGASSLATIIFECNHCHHLSCGNNAQCGFEWWKSCSIHL